MKRIFLRLFFAAFLIVMTKSFTFAQGQGQGNQQWKINGNISDSLHYMGTKNNFPLKLRTNDFERLRITSEGLVGIGTTSPQEKLDVNGNVILRGNVKLPNLPENNGLTGREVVFVNENGKLSRGGGSNLASLLYNPLLACRNDVDGNVPNPLWANGINKIYTDCNLINVGINTDAPRVKLDVRGTAYARQLSLGNTDPTLTAGRFFSLKTFSSTVATQNIFQIENNSSEILTVKNNGAIGIKNANPRVELDVIGTGFVQKVAIGSFTDPANSLGLFHAKSSLSENTSSVLFLIENSARKIFQVDNNGLVQAREFKVNLTNWPDYVFTPTYKLMPLSQVEAFINTFKHLPNVPNAKTVESEVANLGELNKLSFEKIEELTLYLI